jgi:hypothetical protein
MTQQQRHNVSIVYEGPTRSGAFSFSGGHRARCSCFWSSDCYSQLSDTQRAIEVHLRRARRLNFDMPLLRAIDRRDAIIAALRRRKRKAP